MTEVEDAETAAAPAHLRVFLSSPGDVAEERRIVEAVIRRLGKQPLVRGRATFDVVSWDDPEAPLAMPANTTPQAAVTRFGPRPAACEIVIVILWSRLGTHLDVSTFKKPGGEPYLSGTEWEYEDAVNGDPAPDILLYRRTEKPTIEIDDPDFEQKRRQYGLVQSFLARFRNPDGSFKGSITDYGQPADLDQRVLSDLSHLLRQRLAPVEAGQGAAPGLPEIPSAYLDWLWRRYVSVELLGHETQHGHAITLGQVYVPAVTQPDAAPDAALTAAGRKGKGEEKEKPTLLLQRLDQGSLYVPAPPGAGKTTFCRWAVLQCCPAAATVTHPVPLPEGYAEPEPGQLRAHLPVLVPLREFWTAMGCERDRQSWQRGELEAALAAWIARSPPPGLTGALLMAHLGAGSAFLLLDGLDEVPPSEAGDGGTIFPRALLLSGLADALPDWQKAGNRVLLTSRPYGLDRAGLQRLGLPEAPLLPLPRELQALFVTRWFHTLDQRGKAGELIAILRGREDLVPLAENPLLLTAICVIYGDGGRLPEDRYRLYQRLVDNVLFHRYPGDARQREPVKARLQAIAFGMHTGDAERPRSTPAAEVGCAEVERLLRRFADLDAAYEPGVVAPAVQCEELLTRSGLLLPRAGDKAAFHHLSFQEFLAAERIAKRTDDGSELERLFRERGLVPEWRPTLLFLFAGQIFNYRRPEWGLELLGRLIADQDRAAVEANPAPAVLIAEALQLCLAKGYRIPEALAGRLRSLALDAIADEIDLAARQTLGLTLGMLGDPRIVDLRDPGAYVEVPAGRYPFGETSETGEIGAPFRIGRYPVTNSQYRAFIEGGGYRERRWWSDEGWAWLQNEDFTEPRYWHDRRWNCPNQPVVGVGFWEAEACAAWAGGRLPTEEEWEAAGRGPDGHAYPWGDDWRDGICNTDEAGLGVTSSVGLFPGSRQRPFGLEEMAGNVWEWCASLYEPSKGDDGPRVLRGGSWLLYRDYARCAYRGGGSPFDRLRNLGFRVVCSSPS